MLTSRMRPNPLTDDTGKNSSPPGRGEQGHLRHPQYRPDIDGLRAVAVLSVIGFHAFPGRIKGGFVGVDIFFVISGFLISSIVFRNLEEGSFSYGEFYARRIRRIFPALILLLAGCLVLGSFVVPTDYKQWGKHVAAGAGFVSNFAFWNDAGYFDSAAEKKPLLHLWSLGIEEQFYIFWPLLLGFVWKRRHNLLQITLLVAVASFVTNLCTVYSHPIAAFYSPLSRFWEIMAGGMLAYMTLHKREFWPQRANWLAPAGFLLIASGVFLLNKERPFPGWWALLPVAGAFLVISAGHGAWLNRNVLGNRALVWVGLISYPLYLWHWPALYAAREIYGNNATPTESILARVAAVLVSLVLSWLTYKFVETPIRIGARKQGATLSLSAVLAILALGGCLAYETNGFAYRFPPKLMAILSSHYDYARSYRLGVCLLDTDQDQSRFGDCAGQPSAVSKDSLLWGDSHAAHLYPGIQAQLAPGGGVTELTAFSCPPIVDYSVEINPYCKGINDYVLKRIQRERPDRVILAAFWEKYDWIRLEGTIRQLKLLGIRRIDLVGPVPIWQDSLRTQLYDYFKSSKSEPRIPNRMFFGLDGNVQSLNMAMREFAKQHGINYQSPYDILCNSGGCLTMVDDTADTITAWDYGHLTTAGSIYVVSSFKE